MSENRGGKKEETRGQQRRVVGTKQNPEEGNRTSCQLFTSLYVSQHSGGWLFMGLLVRCKTLCCDEDYSNIRPLGNNLHNLKVIN